MPWDLKKSCERGIVGCKTWRQASGKFENLDLVPKIGSPMDYAVFVAVGVMSTPDLTVWARRRDRTRCPKGKVVVGRNVRKISRGMAAASFEQAPEQIIKYARMTLHSGLFKRNCSMLILHSKQFFLK